MQVLVVTLLMSLPMLSYVILLCAMAYLAFGIVGVQVFAGALKHRSGLHIACRTLGHWPIAHRTRFRRTCHSW
jgi:hypothetical protein